MTADLAMIEQTATLLFRSATVVEIRVLNTSRNGTVSGYFDALQPFGQAASQWSGKAPAVYATLNPCHPALLARAANRLKDRVKSTTADKDIVQRSWFPLDFDPVRPADISSTDVEHDAALQRAEVCTAWLTQRGWPLPVAADSGNGGHRLYRIDLPNDDDSRALLQRCLEALAMYFSYSAVALDVSVCNAARIWKVYGTMACKGDNLPERPHRLAQLLDVPTTIECVTRQQLEDLAALVPALLPSAPRRGYTQAAPFDLGQWIVAHGLPVVSEGPWHQNGYRWILNPCPWNSAHTNRSAFIVRFTNGAIAAGCHHNGCTGNNWHALRDLYEPGWQTRSAPATLSGGSHHGTTAPPTTSATPAGIPEPGAARPASFPYWAPPAVARIAGFPGDAGIGGQPDLADVAAHYGATLERTSETELTGPHPQHGQDTGDTLVVESRREGWWYCPRHGTGGDAFALIAVCEGLLPCEHARSEMFTEDLVHRVWRLANEKFPLPPPGPPSSVQWGNRSLVLTPLSDLLQEPDEAVEWLVDGLLPESGFSLLVAKPKVGKTTVARNLALCVAQGRDFLGRTTQQGLVIYLALEEKRAEVKKHFRDMGATGEEAIHLYVASAPADGLQQVRAAAEQLKPVLIIIDPLFRFTRVKDSNDYAQVTQALEPLLVLARETRAHVQCVHHAGKGNREGGDTILGSTAIFAAVDTALILKKLEGYRTLQSEQRYGDNLEETVLRFDQTTRTVTLGDTKEAEDEARIGQAICEYLQGQAAPVPEAVIDANVEGRRKSRQNALRQLVAQGKVTRQGKGGKGTPYTYALAATSPPQDSSSLVPSTILGTWVPESKNGASLSNDAADASTQDFQKVDNAQEPASGLGNQNPAPDMTWEDCPRCDSPLAPAWRHGHRACVGCSTLSDTELARMRAPLVASPPAPSIPNADLPPADGSHPPQERLHPPQAAREVFEI